MIVIARRVVLFYNFIVQGRLSDSISAFICPSQSETQP